MKKNNIKIKVLFLAVVMSFIVNLITPYVSAIEFNPGISKDDEEYKEYNAYLEQLQINTVMGLSMQYDEYGELADDTSSNDLTVEGTVRINKKLDNTDVEFLNDIPVVELIDSNNNVIACADVVCESEFTSNPSDLYYISFYDLSDIENEKIYRLRASFKDNDENEITKLITYSGKLILSEGTNTDLRYMSNNNILNVIFNIRNDKENGNGVLINGIDLDTKRPIAQDCIDNFMSTYNSKHKQIDFDIAIRELEDQFKIYFNEYMSNISDGKLYVYTVKYVSSRNIEFEVSYLLNEEIGMTSPLVTKELSITYTNDNYTISSSVKNQIDNIVYNVPFDTVLEIELDSNYNNKINSYDYKTNILKITDKNIFVKELPSTASLGVFNKIKIIELAIGIDDYIYNDEGGVIFRVKPVISIPKTYSSDNDRLSYAKKIIESSLNGNIYDGFNVESILLDEEDKDIVNVKMVSKSALGTTTITEEVYLKTIDYQKGDLDKNGVVNSNDAAVAQDLYNTNTATEEDIKIGDLDGNGVLNSNDAALILDIYNSGN